MKVKCDNIYASKLLQNILVNNFGVERLGGMIFEVSTFQIIFPPCWCVNITPVHRSNNPRILAIEGARHYPSHESRKSIEMYSKCPLHEKNDKPVICGDGENPGKYNSFSQVLVYFTILKKFAS